MSTTYVLNKISFFSPALKAANVIPLSKTKDPSDPNNFRPISLLSILTKPLERHIHKHLTQFIEDCNLFHPFQSGFLQRHSCHAALIRVCDTWLAATNQTQLTGAVFLDLKKSICPCQSYTSTQEMISLFAEFVNSVSLKVVSARQNTVCFPEWELFYKRSS